MATTHALINGDMSFRRVSPEGQKGTPTATARPADDLEVEHDVVADPNLAPLQTSSAQACQIHTVVAPLLMPGFVGRRVQAWR